MAGRPVQYFETRDEAVQRYLRLAGLSDLVPPTVTDDDLAALAPAPVRLPGLGHNAHVEDPAAVLALARRVVPE